MGTQLAAVGWGPVGRAAPPVKWGTARKGAAFLPSMRRTLYVVPDLLLGGSLYIAEQLLRFDLLKVSPPQEGL